MSNSAASAHHEGSEVIQKSDVEKIERLAGQLASAYGEISALAKKSPNDGVNTFKINFVNKILAECNDYLKDEYRPLAEFEQFNEDELPSNSDVTFILSQYIQAVERLRSDNIVRRVGHWYYDLPEGEEQIHAAPPAKLGK